MSSKRCAISGEADREGRGAGGASTVSRFRLLRGVLLPWVAAAAMLFGGGLAALEQSFTPGSPECTDSGTTVTCKGDLSDGVEVDAGADGTYTELYVNTLDGNIDPPIGTSGIAFTSDSNSNIAITANIGDQSITLESAELSGVSLDVIAGVLASSKGGNVTVDMTGTIIAKGDTGIDDKVRGQSRGIHARSIINNGESGDVTVIMDGDILTQGGDSDGISASSKGDKVTVDMTGTITTLRGNSDGITASLDSGGDMKVIVNKGAVIKTKGDDSKGIVVGGSGAGNMVMGVDVKGAVIETSGTTDSSGIHASFEDGDIPEEDGIIGITVDVTGNITTAGTKSDGIFVQSESKGDGAVDVTVNGNITTSGASSSGIVASVNEGEGNVGIDVTGDILAKGLSGNAIYTAIDGGEISIRLHGGSIISEQDIGVEFGGGEDDKVNSLTISEGAAVTIRGGQIIQVDNVDEKIDVMGGFGNETIDNYGTLTTPGRIDLGTGINTFNNRAGATFYSGTSVVLGDGNAFANWGDLSPGRANAVQRTALTGNFVNTEDGTFTVTIDPTTESSDKLIVTGTATLEGGTVRVTGVTYAYDGRYAILEAAEGVESQFDDVIDTLFIDNRLSYGDGYVALSSVSKGDSFCDFAGTANQRTVACNGLDGLPISGELPQAVLALTTTEEARAAYDALSGEVHASLKGALMDSGQWTTTAISSRMTARFGDPDAQTSTSAFGNLTSLADGSSGFWTTGYGARGETDATSDTARMDTDLGGVLFGIDRALGERWRLGVLGGYNRTDVTQRARSSSGSVNTWTVGLYGGAEVGASGFSFGAIYNGHSADASRTVGFTGFSERLSARYDAWSWQLFAEAGNKMQAGALMLEPFAGVSLISLDTDGFSETGGAAALTASSDTDSMAFTTLGVRGC